MVLGATMDDPMTSPHFAVQGSLLDGGPPALDEGFGALARHRLDEHSWVDHAPGWLRGAQCVFDDLVERIEWTQNERRLFDRVVTEPRLHGWWQAIEGPPPVPIIGEMAGVLSRRYGVRFDSVGFNFYRDGRDSVAWHRDKIPEEVQDPLVAIVSVGEPRTFRLRPRGGGPSVAFPLGHGDLLVTGGRCQRTWEHAVPKVRRAGARISITFRHGRR